MVRVDPTHGTLRVAKSRTNDIQEPLLQRRRSRDSTGLPGSHRRRSSARSNSRHSMAKIIEGDEKAEMRPWIKNLLSIAGVVLVGAAGWAIAWQAGVWAPSSNHDSGEDTDPQTVALGAKVLGYTSAVCYLG